MEEKTAGVGVPDPRVSNFPEIGEVPSIEIRNDADFNISSPIGLKNPNIYFEDGSVRCANVCFFNSLLQILISIPRYHEYILDSPIDNPVIINLKNLITLIDRSTDSIDTYQFVHNLGIPNYTQHMQLDAHECLTHILENSFPTDHLKDLSVFSIQSDETYCCNRLFL